MAEMPADVCVGVAFVDVTSPGGGRVDLARAVASPPRHNPVRRTIWRTGGRP